MAIQEGVVIEDRFQWQNCTGRTVAGHGEGFGGAHVVLRVDLEYSRLQCQCGAYVVTQPPSPMGRRVIAPATAATHGQRVRTEAGADKVGQDGHAAKLGAHHHEADLGRHLG
ncbi:hypothetical protein D9M71_718580 [compost metagenome]